MISTRQAVRAVGRVYRAALVVCPRAVRSRYGAEMLATFESVCDAASSRGVRALLGAASRELWDVVAAGISTRWHTDDVARLKPRLAIADVLSGRSRIEGRSHVGALSQDLRYAWRMLKRQPAFAAIAILTLTLGIGANTAVFTVVNGVLLKPLPYGDPDRLVMLFFGRPGRVSPWFSPLNFRDFTTESGVFSQSAAINPVVANVTGFGEPERVQGAAVSWNFFRLVDVAPIQGRAFTADDAQGMEASVIVLSDGLWKRRYGGRADTVGSVIRLDGKPLTVIGVAPPDLKLPGESQFWEPLIFSPRDLAPDARGAQWVVVVARLQPGVDVRHANSALATVSTRLAGEFPRINQGRIALAMPLHQQMVRFIRPVLLILLGAVSFVLLIACVNVANLLLARAQGRAREVAVRTALGAGRQRLIRQFLAESLLLGGLGAAGGLAVAYWSIRLLVALGPASIPRLSNVHVDASVLLFTIAIGVGTSVLFGLVPALATTGRSTAGIAGSIGRGTIGSGSTRVRQALVVCEMALAVILLVGAGLLVRSYHRLQQVNPGFDSEHVVTFNVSLPSAKYAQLTQIETFMSTLIDRLRAQPGVVSAAGAFGLPFTNNFSAYSSFTRSGEVDSADAPTAAMRIATPDYFKVMRIPVRAGRTFDARDDASAPEVVIVNEQAARRFWPGTNPIGQQIHLGVRLAPGVRSTMKTIVGIVGNVKYGGLDEDSPPEVYLPHAQHQVDSLTIVARTIGDPMMVAPVLRHEVAALDPDLPVADVQPMDQLIGSSIAQRRFTMLLIAAFAAVAVTLAAVGIYGVLAYVVSQRTQEIGVRLAIGASPVDVVRLFVGEGVRLSAIGLTCGILGALAATRVLTTMLFGVTSKDPVTFGGVAGALIAVALVASYVPARRAAWVDPMRALRTD